MRVSVDSYAIADPGIYESGAREVVKIKGAAFMKLVEFTARPPECVPIEGIAQPGEHGWDGAR